MSAVVRASSVQDVCPTLCCYGDRLCSVHKLTFISFFLIVLPPACAVWTEVLSEWTMSAPEMQQLKKALILIHPHLHCHGSRLQMKYEITEALQVTFRGKSCLRCWWQTCQFIFTLCGMQNRGPSLWCMPWVVLFLNTWLGNTAVYSDLIISK